MLGAALPCPTALNDGDYLHVVVVGIVFPPLCSLIPTLYRFVGSGRASIFIVLIGMLPRLLAIKSKIDLVRWTSTLFTNYADLDVHTNFINL